jgi:RND family efflux transporter MFP subunit
VQVQTLPLQQGSLPRTVGAYGIVQAAPGAQISIVAPMGAQIGQLYVRPGQAVAAGAPLIQLQPTLPMQVTYTQAVSALKVTAEASARTRELLTQHLATQQQLSDAEKAEGDARAALDALRAQGAGGPRTVRAPFDAIVTGVSATVRAQVSEGTPLLDLAQPKGLVLIVGVAPADAASIAAGNPVSVTAVGQQVSYTGTVTNGGALVQSDSGLVPVQVTLPMHKFLPGESAQATITVGHVSGYVVPHAAVLIDDNGNSYVVQALGDMAKIVDVQVTDVQGDREVITGPLDPHAPLVLTGNYQAHNGMKLRFASGPASAGSADTTAGAARSAAAEPAHPAGQ